jgi:hypothetical protein
MQLINKIKNAMTSSSKGQSAQGVISFGLIVVVGLYVMVTLGTALANANVTIFIDKFTKGINDNVGLISLAIIGLILAMGLPKLMKSIKGK